MNHFYRSIWNATTGTFVAVAETALAGGKAASGGTGAGTGGSRVGFDLRALVLSLLAAMCSQAYALPQQGVVTAGNASVKTGANSLTITQTTQQAAIDWQSFNVGSGESVRFVQPNSSAVALNRVLGSDPSGIFGNLSSNGKVFLVNPNGILFGAGASVNVGGLVASTLNLGTADFMAGHYSFTGTGTGNAGVLNQGTIHADGGYVALLGAQVSNQGVITARLGTVALAAGRAVTLDVVGDGLLSVTVDQGAVKALVDNSGMIQADGGQVLLTAQAAGQLLSTVVNNTGVVRARTLQNQGGVITLLGDMQSGTVDVGGTLDASAPNGGDGGAIETSAALVKIAPGVQITTASAQGKAGSWLIDPKDFTIAASGGDITGGALSALLGSTDIVIQTYSAGTGPTVLAGAADGNGDINVNDTVTWSAHLLTLAAGNNISINTAMFGSGTATLSLLYGFDRQASGNPSLLTINAPVNLPSGNSLSEVHGYDGTRIYYTVINSLGEAGSYSGSDLQGIEGHPGSSYALGSNIDASATMNWQGGAGFVPIQNFSGNFEGLGHVIKNLTINRPNLNQVGLFANTWDTWDNGNTNTIQNVGLVGGSVLGGSQVGALIGHSRMPVFNAYATATVHGTSSQVGGLVGESERTITDSYATGAVSGDGSVGGLVGTSYGQITNSHATGNVVSSQGTDVGGLVGTSGNLIDQSYATGIVAGAANVGGLVGQNLAYAEINASGATGAVAGTDNIGGLVGLNGGWINASFATGSVTGSGNAIGGLVGSNSLAFNPGDNNAATTTNSYATGRVTGIANVGGLVGFSDGPVDSSYAMGSVTGISYVGGLVGLLQDDSGSYAGPMASIQTSYSTGAVVGNHFTGGLFGAMTGSASASGFFDSDTAGQVTGGPSLTTAQMQSISAWGAGSGFNFVSSGGRHGNNWVLVNADGSLANGNQTTSSATFPMLSAEYSTQIMTAHQLQLMVLNPSASYTLAKNIDASATGTINDVWANATFIPVGNDATPFYGSFNGQGHTISGLTLSLPGQDGVGLFGLVQASPYGQSLIENVGLVDSNVTGNSQVGALVGELIGDGITGSVVNSYASGTVFGAGNDVGGLVGSSGGLGTVENSHASGSVTGGNQIGGLVGFSLGTVTNSYATATVSGNDLVGGLVGANVGHISTSYAAGAVSGDTHVGGLAGGNQGIDHFFTLPGPNSQTGLVGGGSVDSSYWNIDATGQATDGSGSAGVTGLTTAQMRIAANLPGFNFTSTPGANGNNWVMVNADGSLANNGQNVAGATFPMLASEYSTTLNNAHQLQLMAMDLGGNYTLGANINASATGTVNDAWAFSTFAPVGSLFTPFTGSLNGQGFAIGALTISIPGTDDVGLFGAIGAGAVVQQVVLEGGSVAGQSSVGALVGYNGGGTITGSTVSAVVTGTGNSVGGLVGFNDVGSTISGSTANGAVSSTGTSQTTGAYVGGLVGYNSNGSITTSNANGAVSGRSTVGGLVGASDGSGEITSSYATGAISGGDTVGGVVGYNDGDIANSYATGVLTSGDGSGGIAGAGYGSIESSYFISNSAIYSAGQLNYTTTPGLPGNNWVLVNPDGSLFTFQGGSQQPSVPYGTQAMLSSEYSTLITNAHQLQLMAMDPTAHYTLTNNINASETGVTTGAWTGATFVPIGSQSNPFSGTFDGQGHSISGLTVNGSNDTVGLFSVVGGNGNGNGGTQTGAIQNVALLGGSVTGGNQVGALVGALQGGVIGNSSSTGAVTGTGDDVGGLVGADNEGVIGNSAAAGAVQGVDHVGGLVGRISNGSVDGSHASGTVTGSGDGVGGLVGNNIAAQYDASDEYMISNSWATGSVHGVNVVGGLVGSDEYAVYDGSAVGLAYGIGNSHASGAVVGTGDNVGGLVGFSQAPIGNSYATGTATGVNNVGGLVGANEPILVATHNWGAAAYAISNSYATGAATGTGNNVGGLVGINDGSAPVDSTYASGLVTGGGSVGGLMGSDNGNGNVTHSYWNMDTSGQSGSAAGVGLTSLQMQTPSSFDGFSFGVQYDGSGQNPVYSPGAHWVMVGMDGSLDGAGNVASATMPMLLSEYSRTIDNAHQLQLMLLNPAATYVLGSDIHASGTGSAVPSAPYTNNSALVPYTSGATDVWLATQVWTTHDPNMNSVSVGTDSSFVPIGSAATPFTGSLKGQGHTIDQLTVNMPATEDVGLFGFLGSGASVQNVALTNVDIIGQNHVGGLVGSAVAARLDGITVTGTVSAPGGGSVGGVAGRVTGGAAPQSYDPDLVASIVNSHSSAVVSGFGELGGLAGYVDETVIGNSGATGAVTGSNSNYGPVGGLIGETARSYVHDSYATGAVSSYGDFVGGLVGFNGGEINASYAAGSVSGALAVGGLVGENAQLSIGGQLVENIANSYATGSVVGSSFVGGLVGQNNGGIGFSYSSGGVFGNSDVGGLVGTNNNNNSGFVDTNLWNGASAGQNSSALGAQGDLTSPDTYSGAGWNLSSVWVMVNGQSAPYLRSLLTPVTVTVGNTGKTYDSYNDAGWGNSSVAYSVNLDSSLYGGNVAYTSADAQTAINAGTYATTASGLYATSQQGYLFNYSDGGLMIGKAALTVSSSDVVKTYDGTLNATGNLTAAATPVALTNLAGIDSLGGGTFSFLESGAGAGKTVTVSGVAVNDGNNGGNYNVTYVVNTNSTINRAQLTVTAADKQKTYGDANPTFTSAITGYVNNEDTSSAGISGVASASSTANASTGAGTATITSDVSGMSATNYSFSPVDGTLRIDKAQLTVTADHQQKTYGDANPTLTTAITGYVLNQTSSTSGITGTASATTTADATTGAGTAVITAGAGTLASSNYSFITADGTLTIGKAQLTVTADNQQKTYGDANPTLTTAITGYVLNQTGLTSGVTGTGTATTTAEATTGAGTAVITADAGTLASSNYSFVPADGTLTIGKAQLTVTADNQQKMYGDTNPTLTTSITGYVLGQTVLNSGITGVATAVTTADASTDAGTAIITAGGGTLAASNYDFTTADGTLTINKAQLTVTADNRQRTYGSANPALTSSITGYVLGQNATSANVTGAATVSTAATASTDAGSAVITASGGTLAASNYDFTTANGTLTINKAQLTVTADNRQRTYGSANPALTSSITGYVLGQNATSANVTGAATVSTAATASTDAGSAVITASGGTLAASNYDFTTADGTLTINKAQLTVTADNRQRTYGSANPALTSSITGYVLGQNATSANVTGAATVSTAATASTDAGSAVITASGGTLAASNYDFTTADGTLTINKAQLTVTADNRQRTYGSANPALTSSITGYVLGQNATSANVTGAATVSTAATASTDAGSAIITAGGGTLAASNYDFTTADGTLTINKAQLTVTADNRQRTYGSANPALTSSITGYVLGQNATSANVTGAATVSTAATASTDAGSAVITASGGTLAASNYDFTTANGTLTIGKAQLTVTADNQQKTYGDVNPTMTTSITGYVLNQTGATSGVTGTGTATTTAEATTGAGTAVITAGGGTLAASNYDFTTADGTLTINKAQLTVTADNRQRTYGSANPALTSSITGYVLGQNATSANVTGAATVSTAATASADAGSAVITAGGGTLAASNYDFTTADGTLTINKAQLTVTADNRQRTYGSANPALTSSVTGYLLGQNATSANVTGAATVSTAATASTDAGSAVITASGGTLAASNYDFTTANGTLTINKAQLTVTADNRQRTYGSANPALTSSITGYVLGQNATSANVTGAATVSTAATASTDAGSAVITASGGTLAASNYDFTTADGTLTINKAQLTVTADNRQRTYGSANPALTSSITGYVLGQNATSANVTGAATVSTAATASTDAGSAVITASGGTLAASNYDFTTADGTLTINKAQLTVTADNRQRTYGSANPALTSSITGYVLGQNATSANVTGAATVSTAATASTDAGSAIITAGGGTLAASNYDFTTADGTLTINKAQLTVTADNRQRTYGSANPALTSSITGYVLGQNATSANVTGAATVSTAATASTDAGSAVITASGGTLAASNYDFTTANGTLTIGKAQLTVTADNQQKTYGDVNPTMTTSITGYVLNQTGATSGVTGTGTATTTAEATTGAGTAVITAGGGTLAASNYDFTTADGTLTINKAQLTVTADNRQRTYGSANPALTSSITGYVLGQNATSANVTGAATVSTAATASTDAGSAVITASGGTLAASNYDFTTANGTLTIGKAQLTVTADNQQKTYGDVNPTMTTSITGYVLNQTGSTSGVTGTGTATTTAEATTGAGTAVITAGAGTLASSNYSFVPADGTLTIGKAQLTVTADNQQKMYGDANPTLTTSITGYVLGQTVLNSGITGVATAATTADASTDAGTAIITAGGGTLAASNYDFTTADGTLTINKAQLTVIADSVQKTYGSINPTLTTSIAGYVLGQTALNSGVTGAGTATTTADANSDAGAAVITAGGGTLASGNYDFTTANGTLTINKAQLTVTADNRQKTYGSANPALTSTVTGYVLGQNATSAIVTGTANVSSAATASTGAGTAVIVAGAGNLAASNYDFATANGTLTIDKAQLTLTADNQQRTYGAANPALTSTITGYVLGQSATSADITGTAAVRTAATAATIVGKAAITAGAGTLSSTNYDFKISAGTLTITPALLTVTADNQTRLVGEVNPPLTSTFTGFVNGQTLATSGLTGQAALATTATTQSPVGSFAISIGGGDLAVPNYVVATLVPGLLTVAPASTHSSTVADAIASAVAVTTGVAVPTVATFLAPQVTGTQSEVYSDSGTTAATTTSSTPTGKGIDNAAVAAAISVAANPGGVRFPGLNLDVLGSGVKKIGAERTLNHF